MTGTVADAGTGTGVGTGARACTRAATTTLTVPVTVQHIRKIDSIHRHHPEGVVYRSLCVSNLAQLQSQASLPGGGGV